MSEVLSGRGYGAVSTEVSDYGYGTAGVDMFARRSTPGRIRRFAMGERTDTARHRHAWVVFDYRRRADMPPVLLFAE